MLGRFAVAVFLLLLAKEFESADGYAFPIRKRGFVTACVSDETPIAFVKDFHVQNDDTTVDVVDLSGNSIQLVEHDCNLVQKEGCKKWNLKEWIKESNVQDSIDQYSMVTDYRWNDLPIKFTTGVFKEKIKIPNNHNFNMHFSILTHDSAQFLVTNDPTLDNGINAVIDGWGYLHKSVLRYCPKINGTLSHDGQFYASCEGNLMEKRDYPVLRAGRKWAHATLEIQFDKPNEIDLSFLEDHISIKVSSASASLGNNDYYVSIRITNSKRGFFKSHKYSIIRPKTASSSMEVQLEEDSTSSFCVDVVFLTNESIFYSNTIFSVGVMNAIGSNIFNKTVQSTDNYLKWTTERFEKWDVILKKGWKIKLTAHDESLVIGGVKFCKKGDLVTKTKMVNATNCYPLVQRAENQTADKNDYNRLLYQLGECKVFGGNCEGYKLCHSQDNCTCFAGYQGETCTSCQVHNFGINCADTTKKRCSDNKVNYVDGNCLKGCAVGYQPPQCESECKGRRFGRNCASTSWKHCSDDKFDNVDGTCEWGCKVGYQPPLCDKECSGKGFGQDCSETSSRVCLDGKHSPINGRCTQGCAYGYKPPNCTEKCQGNKYGKNCTSTSMKHCFEDIFNHVDGNCLKGCAVGYQPPECDIHESNKQSNVLIAILIIVPLIFVLLALIGAWIYFKKSRKPQQIVPEATVQFTNASETLTTDLAPLVEENRGDGPIYDVPFDASQVEQYLQSAFMNNFLHEEFKKFPRGQTQPWEVGTKPENTKKNRYNDLSAYDSSRVKLDLLPGDEHSDYINANYVDGFERPKTYIASQGPMASTVDDFWRMVWQEQVSLIVMLTNLTEDEKVKCEKYWPDADQEGKFGRLTVRNIGEEINADYVSRDLLVIREKTKKIVQQLHYTNWPNHGVPLYPQSIAIFMEKITHRNELAPILVHCSAGVGRTGTVILIDACLKMVRSRGQLDVVSIFSQMRKQRANLVDTLEQFEFVHLVLLESLLNPKFEINCENFTEEYKHLKSKSNKNIKKNLELLTDICNKDFQRTDKPAEIEANKCRYPDFISRGFPSHKRTQACLR
ncbi:uncharacterized protein LOC135942876 [Cloeon dipterum]|uniref:uncharacterized protein LOC135942876 n=1 Tax=Cloeon dipterum TaxID=197152 RepID=UPI00321FCD68